LLNLFFLSLLYGKINESALIGKIFATLAFLFGPIWLALAIIRQVFFEKWQ